MRNFRARSEDKNKSRGIFPENFQGFDSLDDRKKDIVEKTQLIY
jgi:hypothetical protein